MAADTDDEARRLHAYVSTDNLFQRLARVRQARWRERTGLPIGEHNGRPLGSPPRHQAGKVRWVR